MRKIIHIYTVYINQECICVKTPNKLNEVSVCEGQLDEIVSTKLNSTTICDQYLSPHGLRRTLKKIQCHQCSLQLHPEMFYSRRRPYLNAPWLTLWTQAHLRWTERLWTRVLWMDETNSSENENPGNPQ